VKFPGEEIICGKCFRALPEPIRREYRTLRRRERKLLRLIARRVAAHSIDPATIDLIQQRMFARFDANWSRIVNYFVAPERPVGLEAFLQEMRL
jgi:hypothetical protein